LSPLGMPADGDWVMYAPNSFEPVLIHNPFMHQLSRDIGRYSPNTRFVEVYFVGSGTGAIDSASYAGIYVLMDRIEVGKDRVDAGTLEPENLTLPSLSGGYLMKIDRLDPGDSGIFAANQTVALVDPREDQLKLPARAAQLNYIRNYLTSFGNALYDNTRFTNPVTGFRAYIDTGSWVDHHLLNVLSFNVDALRLSAFFYKKREGKIHFGPIWDFDRTLGSTDGRDSNPRVWRSQSSDLGTDFFNYPWWDRVFRDPEFFSGLHRPLPRIADRSFCHHQPLASDRRFGPSGANRATSREESMGSCPSRRQLSGGGQFNEGVDFESDRFHGSPIRVSAPFGKSLGPGRLWIRCGNYRAHRPDHLCLLHDRRV